MIEHGSVWYQAFHVSDGHAIEQRVERLPRSMGSYGAGALIVLGLRLHVGCGG